MLNKLTGFIGVAAGFILAIAIIAFAHFMLQVPEGGFRLLVFGIAAAVFFGLAFNGTLYNKQGK
jgi:hypothetical protein